MIEAKNITKTYVSGATENLVLKGVDFKVDEGEFVSVVGRSGSGKSTLLSVLSTLLSPDSGELSYRGRDISVLPGRKLNELRHRDFAVIFQMHHLLPYLTALENVLLPFMNQVAPVSRKMIESARSSLDQVGLNGKYDRLPRKLSGGEQQRVAIARALVKNSSVLFADEPTGSLDKATGESIMNLLKELNKDGLTVVMVTHDSGYASYADRMVIMDEGLIKSQ
jgi:putative ABC transport system ATP-binding protein